MLNNLKVITAVLLTIYSLSYSALSRMERINERIKPLGSVYLTEGAQLDLSVKPKLGKDAGIKRYKVSCYICHDTGAAGAPKLGVKAAWTDRLSKGKETLYNHAIKGFNGMPAKGGCLNCSDEEIIMSVDYMLQKIQ